MEYRKFEKHISNVLNAEEAHLDIDSLIRDIHLKVERKGRIPVFWLIWTGLLLFSGLAVMVYFSELSAVEPGYKMTINAQPTDCKDGIAASSIVKQLSDKVEKIPEIKQPNKVIVYNAEAKKTINFKKDAQSVSMPIITKPSVFADADAVEVVNHNNNEFTSNIEKTSPLKAIRYNVLSSMNPGKIQINTEKVICPSFSRKGRMYLELAAEAGMFLPLKKLENNASEEGSVYQLRYRNEKTLEGLNAGLYLHLRKENSPVYIKSGISWSRLTERMPLQYSYSRKDTTRGIISITVSQTGDTVTTIYGDIVTERKLSGNKTRHYSLSLWDLPLAVGAEKRFGQWSLGVEAGIMLNLTMKTVGNILATDTSFAAINLSSADFKNTVGVSYFGGVLLGRDFNRAGRIYLAARMRYIPDPFSSDSNPIRQSYNFFGLNLGYLHTF